VTLVDQDHIRWQSRKLIARTIRPTPSLFVAQAPKAIHQLPGKHGEILGKSGVLEHKGGNISETRKDTGKVTMEGLQEVTNALSNAVMSYTAFPSPTLGVLNPNPKLQSLLSQERIRLRTSNLAGTFTGFNPNKSPLQIWEKRERGRVQGLTDFLSTPYYLRNV